MGIGVGSSISNIDYRISELQREMQTEINYITGLYGSYGIANQLPSKIAEISSKFQSQISSLENQKSELLKQEQTRKKEQDEIQLLKKQLAEIETKLNQTPANQTRNKPIERPSAIAMFEYIDSLPIDEASQAYLDLK